MAYFSMVSTHYIMDYSNNYICRVNYFKCNYSVTVSLSFVEIINFRGDWISNRLIDLNFGLNVAYGVVQVQRV